MMEDLRTYDGIADFGKRIENLTKEISTDSDETSHAWIALRHHLAEMNGAYLTNWADADCAGAALTFTTAAPR